MKSGSSIRHFFDVVEKTFGFLDETQMGRFIGFHGLLIDWNKKINLVSRREVDLLERHFLNSLAIAYYVKLGVSDHVADIGSGGGFPAVPLKILSPSTTFVLFESVQKKASFLNIVKRELGFDRFEIVGENVERHNHSGRFHRVFDYVTARAVEKLTGLSEMSEPLLKGGGKMLFLKGKNFRDEIDREFTERKYAVTVHSLSECPLYHSPQDGHLLVISKRPVP